MRTAEYECVLDKAFALIEGHPWLPEPPAKGFQFASLALLGIYYAATKGVLAAVASTALAPEMRTSGLALLNTVLGICKFVSSVLFGWLWVSGAMKTPVWVFSFGLLAAFMVSTFILGENKISWASCKGCFGCKQCGKRF